ncbi:MAG: hypothetical protein K8R54_14070 [Bacteroidales bacterium]|nr:hypothetical protein [Bacteroidales bacterium]
MIPGIELLESNHAGAMTLKDGRTINYGIIRIDKNKDIVVFYTGKALQEIWNTDISPEEKRKSNELKEILEQENGEQKLIKLGYIEIISINDIEKVIF